MRRIGSVKSTLSDLSTITPENQRSCIRTEPEIRDIRGTVGRINVVPGSVWPTDGNLIMSR